MRDLLATRASASPNATALADADSGREWTYAALDDGVETTAGLLAARGVERGDHVGVLAETRPAFVRLVFACQRLGATLVPLNVRLAVPELRAQVERADLTALVCERDTEDDATAIAGDVPVATVDSPAAPGVEALDDADPATVERAELARDDRAALVFTSGTTGDPKAVELTVGNFLAAGAASAFRLGVTPDDRWLCPLSMYHVGGLSIALRCALYGTTCVIQRDFDAEATLRTLDEYDCTGVSVVPTMLKRMLRAERGFPESLRFVLCGGAPTPPELVAACAARDVPVHPSYGMTEAASQIATARPDEAAAHEGTVGRPLFGTTVTVVGEDGDPVPRGETGELCVTGPSVTPGYYGDPDATADAFGPHGLRTGDVGYRDDAGRLYVLNRRSDRIVTGGESVDPGRVADVARAHPAVDDVAVVGLPDDEWGERVAAVVVPVPGTSPDPADLAADWAADLAGFERPRTVAVVGELPRTASGTVDREAARELAAAGVEL
ncbi:MAG: class I adenylate-forming enzyme family protein [Halarchaeum sp.]